MSKFNKLVVCFVFMLVLTVLTVFGDNSTTYVACSNNQSQNLIPCSIITPYVTGCSNFTYNVVYGGVVIESEMLINLSGDYYGITFNHTMLGDYFIWLCNGDTAWMDVNDLSGISPGTFVFSGENAPVCPLNGTMAAMYWMMLAFACAFIFFALISPGTVVQAFAAIASLILLYISYNMIACYPAIGVIMLVLSIVMFVYFCIRAAVQVRSPMKWF